MESHQNAESRKQGSQWRLLIERRFAPFFVAQALAAFNDNLFKNVLVLLATFKTSEYTTMPPALLANLAAGLFILPYVLFSGVAGQLADRYDQTQVLKVVKATEIAIMCVAAVGFWQHDIVILLAALFLMGVHSTFFAPAKYGYLPQVLRSHEIVGGNGMVEMGTFLAILLGTLVAGLLGEHGHLGWIIGATLGVAVIGFIASLGIPKLAPTDQTVKVDWNLWTSSVSNIKVARESRVVFLAILGISWFWFYGAIVLAQLPTYTKSVINGNEDVVTMMLVLFSAGVGLGSLLCERMSGHKVEIGLVPFGSIGLTVFAVDLFFATPLAPAMQPLSPGEFLALPGGYRMAADMALIGLFGGFYIVPLYSLVQQTASKQVMSRVISTNNILNAVFMVVAAGLAAACLSLGVTIPQLLLITAVLNACVAIYIYSLVPEFLLRFVAWLMMHLLYRLKKRGIDNIPEEGAALLVCNHVSFVDALAISAACPRPIRFVMESAIFKMPIVNTFARGMKAIPIASAKEDREAMDRAFATVAKELREGNLVCIFPEGKLTTDGEMNIFRPGMTRILSETPVPVVPLALSGLWTSMFSRAERAIWRRLPRRMFAKITVSAGLPVAPELALPEVMRERVLHLRGEVA
jgi:1-acyl-sn-glycerol-3-phosphate acyltransferase